MADIFSSKDANALLKNKFTFLIGDSNMRNLYKDLLGLVLRNDLSPDSIYHQTGKQKWKSYLGDKMLQKPLEDSQGRNHVEEREFKNKDLHIRFQFITKVYGSSVVSTLHSIEKGLIPIPDILVLNSCLWDVSRWGPDREDAYKEELVMLLVRLKKLLPDDTLIIWMTTLPVAIHNVKGGVFIKQLEYVKKWARFMIMEANQFTEQLCLKIGIDLLDMHYYMRFQIDSRTHDGVHWETQAMRYMSCLLLTHISVSFHVPLPGKHRSQALQNKLDELEQDNNEKVQPELNEEILKIISLEIAEPCTKLQRKSPGDLINARKTAKGRRRLLTESKVPEKNRESSFIANTKEDKVRSNIPLEVQIETLDISNEPDVKDELSHPPSQKCPQLSNRSRSVILHSSLKSDARKHTSNSRERLHGNLNAKNVPPCNSGSQNRPINCNFKIQTLNFQCKPSPFYDSQNVPAFQNNPLPNSFDLRAKHNESGSEQKPLTTAYSGYQPLMSSSLNPYWRSQDYTNEQAHSWVRDTVPSPPMSQNLNWQNPLNGPSWYDFIDPTRASSVPFQQSFNINHQDQVGNFQNSRDSGGVFHFGNY